MKNILASVFNLNNGMEGTSGVEENAQKFIFVLNFTIVLYIGLRVSAKRQHRYLSTLTNEIIKYDFRLSKQMM